MSRHSQTQENLLGSLLHQYFLIINVYGGPCSGKTTLVEALKDYYNLPIVDAGKIFRQLLQSKSKVRIDQGSMAFTSDFARYVLPEMATCLINKQGFLSTGNARTVEEVKMVFDLLRNLEQPYVYVAVRLQVDPAEVKRRQKQRLLETPTKLIRPDDDPERFPHRLDTYHRELTPVYSFYQKKGCLLELDGNPSATTVLKNAIELLDKHIAQVVRSSA